MDNISVLDSAYAPSIATSTANFREIWEKMIFLKKYFGVVQWSKFCYE